MKTMTKKNPYATLLDAAYPQIDPGKSCEEYHLEGYDGTPESDVWWEIDDLAERRNLTFEDAAHLFLKTALGVSGLAAARQAHRDLRLDTITQYRCRVVALSILREDNDYEFATNMATVDAYVARVLSTTSERWSMDLSVNFPDLGLDIAMEKILTYSEDDQRTRRFANLSYRIDEVDRCRAGEYADTIRWILRNALSDDEFAQARHSLSTHAWDEKIRYRCRIAALIYLRQAEGAPEQFSLAQIDDALPWFLLTNAELLEKAKVQKREVLWQHAVCAQELLH